MASMMASMVERIRAAVQESIEQEAKAIVIHDAIASLIREKYEGKKLTQRFANDLRTRLGYSENPIVRYAIEYGMPRVQIWGRETPWESFNDSPTFYMRNPIATLADFEASDTCHGSAARERQAQRIALLNDPKSIASLCVAGEAYQRSLKTINEALEFEGAFTADRYTIEKIVKGEV